MKGKRIISGVLAVMTFMMFSGAPGLPLSVAALGDDIEDAESYTLDATVTDAVPINETTFPDSTFRSYVSDNFDTDKSGGLSQAEINEVTNIDVRSSNIASLKGVEYFANLKTLYCYDNKLDALDVSMNTHLSLLSCGYNQLDVLDVKNNTELTGLFCGNNSLTELDVRSNTALTNLDCENNFIFVLDLKSNTDLTYLYCNDNLLTSLDLSYNTSLKEATFDNNYYLIDVIGSFCLGSLPEGFDASKASDWQGAEFDKGTNSLINFTSETVTYSYDCSNGKSATFTLIADRFDTDIIKESPSYTSVIEGLDASLSVRAEGTVTYQWQKASGDSWVDISGETSSVLELNNVTYDMDGTKYRCIVSAADKAVTSGEAVITVKPAEQVTVSEVEAMSIDEVIKFVNAYCARYDKSGKDTAVITEAQMNAIERVLENDYKG